MRSGLPRRVAYISWFGSMNDGFLGGLFEDPEYLEIVRQDLETGVHRPNKDNAKYFTDAYCHHPDEIEREVEEAHIEIVDHVAVEGVGGFGRISIKFGRTRDNALSRSVD